MVQRIVLLLLGMCALGSSFLMSVGFLKPTRKYGVISGFEAKDLNEIVKPIGTAVKMPTIDPASYNVYNLSSAATAANVSEGDVEKVFRTYPFEDRGLPLLQDHNNYFSGSFKDMFWHQNADNFFLFMPIGDDIERKDVHVQFEALSVCVKIRGEVVAQFPCEQRLIPAGSFWLFDKDAEGRRYVHLDIEKRYRMINWNKLFGEPATLSASQQLAAKSKMLQQLNEANEGMAKLSNMQPETMRELVSNLDLDRMIEGAEDEIPPPVVTVTDEAGNQTQMTPEEAGVEWDPEKDGVLDLKMHEEIKKQIERGEAVDVTDEFNAGGENSDFGEGGEGGESGESGDSGDKGGSGGSSEEEESTTDESTSSTGSGSAHRGSDHSSGREAAVHGSEVDTSSGINADTVSSSIDDA